MVNLLEVATREFAAGRADCAIQLLKEGLGWLFYHCWLAKQQYEKWIQRKMEQKYEKVNKINEVSK